MAMNQGIEVGHVFKLGTKYSKAMGANFLDDKGHEIPVIMGCYGIGVNRIVAAAVEAAHDDNGIIWPIALAPYHALIIPLQIANPAVMQAAESLASKLEAAGYDVLIDDRDQRPGFKFKDADLIGIPLRVVISERGLKEGTDRGQVADRRRRPQRLRRDRRGGRPRRAGGDPPVGRVRRRRAEDRPGRLEGEAMSAARPKPRYPYVLLGADDPGRDRRTLRDRHRAPGRPEPDLAARPGRRVGDAPRHVRRRPRPDARLPLARPGQPQGVVEEADCVPSRRRPGRDRGPGRPRPWSPPRSLLCLALSALARAIAPRFGLVDRPGGRKAHRAPTPLAGGVAIWLTVVLMLALGGLTLGLRARTPSRSRSPGTPMAPGSGAASWP